MAIRRRIVFLAPPAFCTSLAIAGCSERSNSSRTADTEVTASSTPSAAPAVGEQQTLVSTAAGPTINVDSSTLAPRIEFANNTYVLKLPVSAAKVLFDSFPNFSPSQLKAFGNTGTPPFTYLHANVELPSVLIGDFNGDSKLDVALEGRSKQTSAAMMLLSTSPSTPTPQLVVMTRNDTATSDSSGYLGLLHPQEIKDPYEQTVAAILRFDGVQRVVKYQSSTVYYLENGILKQYAYPGD